MAGYYQSPVSQTETGLCVCGDIVTVKEPRWAKRSEKKIVN